MCGGHPVKVEGRCENGYFIEPTVIEGLGPNCQTNQEEILVRWLHCSLLKQKKKRYYYLANATHYGLAATIWTQDITKANRVAAKVEKWYYLDQLLVAPGFTNTIHGGLKNSGVGRRGLGGLAVFYRSEKYLYTIVNMSDIIHTDNASKPLGAYPHARRAGNFVSFWHWPEKSEG